MRCWTKHAAASKKGIRKVQSIMVKEEGGRYLVADHEEAAADDKNDEEKRSTQIDVGAFEIGIGVGENGRSRE